ncbi:MAG: hypothetical protein AMJ54_16795 [Deltaproteobacteria bacterium SG8_13]|nr:MAG: hypothetical protein AMJ54_16795 [Deltaproteobacteria bacterium SG8_13]
MKSGMLFYLLSMVLHGSLQQRFLKSRRYCEVKIVAAIYTADSFPVKAVKLLQQVAGAGTP